MKYTINIEFTKMEKPHFVSGEMLEPANLRLGHVIKRTLPVFTQSFENKEWLTAGDIERRIPIVTAGVRRAIQRLNEIYIPTDIEDNPDREFVELMMNDFHPEKTWVSKEMIELPANTYQLSPQGYSWARFAIDTIVLMGDKRTKNSQITGSLKKLREQ